MTNLGHVAWENYSHQSLWDMIVPADPHAVMQRATDLDQLAKTMGEDIDHVWSLLQRLLSTWSGPSADQTAAAVQPVLKWAADAATTASEISGRLGRYADAINKARTHMPAPVNYQQLDAVADGQAVDMTNLSLHQPELTAMAHGDTATAAQAAAKKAEAVTVMRHYEHESAAAYHGLPTFTKPPKLPGLVSKPPAPQPPPPPVPQPPAPPVPQPPPAPPHDGDSGPTAPGSSHPSSTQPGATTLSSFGAPAGGPLTSGVLGGQPGPGGFGGGLPGIGAGAGVGGIAGSAGVSGVVGGPGPSSAVLPVASEGAEESRLGGLGPAAATEEGGWGGFGPMAGGARSDRDGDHRNRYAGKPDLFGELPPAYPPVLGL